MASRGIVIDANVARAAGGRPRGDSCSTSCRLFLLEQKQQGIGLVMTPAVWEEWNTHASAFAKQWLTAMMSRGLVVRPAVRRVACVPTIKQLVPETTMCVILKDLLLIEAANASGQLVCSHDKEARSAFGKVACRAREIGNIVWVDPCEADESPLTWLRANAPWSRARALCTKGD